MKWLVPNTRNGDGSADPGPLLLDDGDHPDSAGHRVIAQAVADSRRARDLADEMRHVAALELLEDVFRRARDIDRLPDSGGSLQARLEASRDIVAQAGEIARSASASNPASLTAAAVMRLRITDHEGLNSAATVLTVEPARNVRFVAEGGAITVSWDPSATGSVTYRVVRIGFDGSTRTLGRTAGTELSDGSRPDPVPPVYEVTAVLAGNQSAPARSDAAPAPAAPTGGDAADTISYEIVTRMSTRLPRIYCGDLSEELTR